MNLPEADYSTAVLVALDRDSAKQFFGHRNDGERLALVQSLAGNALKLSDSWRALESCFQATTDGQESALSACLLGGRKMQESESAIVVLLRPDMVPAVATALADFRDEALRRQCDSLDQPQVENLQSKLVELREFYRRAAENRAATVFAAWS